MGDLTPAPLHGPDRPIVISSQNQIQNQNQNQNQNQSQNQASSIDWETKARTWMSSLGPDHDVSTDEIDAWIRTNLTSLPIDLISLPRPHLHRRILDLLRPSVSVPQEAAVNSSEQPCPRFQRTDHWKPVYSWLESLNSNKVVTSEEISDWLSKNPKAKEKLISKYARHHLKHYIQRCHLKMLKRREKLRKAPDGIQAMESHMAVTPRDVNNEVAAEAIPPPSQISNHSVKHSDISSDRKSEASLRFELLTDLQNELRSYLSRRKQSGDFKESGLAFVQRQRP